MRIWTAVILIAAAGCRRAPPPSGHALPAQPSEDLPTTAPAARWEKCVGCSRLVLDGHDSLTFDLSYGVDGEINVSSIGRGRWPKDTVVAIGKEEHPLLETTKFTDVWSIYGSIPAPRKDNHAIRSSIDPSSSKLAIKLRNGVTIAVPLPAGEVSSSLPNTVMTYAAKHPLTFDGEPAHAKPHTVFFTLDGAATYEVVGPGKTLADTDWIAFVTREAAQVPGVTCHYERGSYPLERDTQTVTLLDRQTGSTIETKTFAPTSKECPILAYDGHAWVSPSHDALLAWITSKSR